MPELPEVETVVRKLRAANLLGKTIQHAIVYSQSTIANPNSAQFISQIQGQDFKAIERRGKFIVITLGQQTLLIHLRMTGKLFASHEENLSSSQNAIHPHERVRLCFSDGQILHYEDQRKFGRWSLVKDPRQILDGLGVEPLSKSFDLSYLKAGLHRRQTTIKALLLNQKFIAGLGNIYVDEALWLAQVHPMRLASELNSLEIEALHYAIVKVLEVGISNQGTTLGNHRSNYTSLNNEKGRHQSSLNVFRREGLPCPRCDTVIAKIRVAQRGTHFCPFCQKLGGK